MRTEDLWGSPRDCCGCGACAARCPRGAIAMMEGEDGFVYPKIDDSLCVNCGLCRRVCGLQNRYAQTAEGPFYAASFRGDSSLSASAGAFYALARGVVSEGGAVFGAAYVRNDSGLRVRHVMAEDLAALSAIQGSKYVQSDAGACFPDVLRQLKAGRLVLFSGTPCQVAGLRGFLGREWSNLVTVDLVCHGVPSEAMLRGYLRKLEQGCGKRVVDARFRSKRDGWKDSLLLCIRYEDGSLDNFPSTESSYYDLFLNLKILRDSCYSCPFAGPLRPGDLTVGDFWGVERNRPDVLKDGRFDVNKGISCLLGNTERGKEALADLGADLDLFGVSFEEVARGNDQLRHPSELSPDRALYLSAFCEGGWDAVEVLWQQRERGIAYRLKYIVKVIVPKPVVRLAKRMLGRK